MEHDGIAGARPGDTTRRHCLLPDGRVLQAGSGQLPGYPVTNERTAQIYSPPYLFKGLRPTILSAPSTLQYGCGQFQVGTTNPSAISKVSLVRLGSETHNFDQNQRFVPLNFSTGANALNVRAPANPRLAPPGYYMLFILNSAGVPSVSTMVRLPIGIRGTARRRVRRARSTARARASAAFR